MKKAMIALSLLCGSLFAGFVFSGCSPRPHTIAVAPPLCPTGKYHVTGKDGVGMCVAAKRDAHANKAAHSEVPAPK